MQLLGGTKSEIAKRSTPAAAWVWWNLPEEEKEAFLKELLPNAFDEREWPVAVDFVEGLFMDILSADDFQESLGNFNSVENLKATKNYCKRCGGKGSLEAYKQINGGRCYSCNGLGKAGH